VRELRRTPEGFALVVGSAADPERLTADEVVVAVPAAPAARLLREVAPVAAAELAGVETASVAVVTLAVRAAEWTGDGAGEQASGFLVPPVDGRRIKAATFSFNKWDWVREAGRSAGGVVLLRTSLGRHREEAALQVPDEELVAASLADLAEATGVRPTPVDAHVQRWGGGLPQYAVGHLDRVARIRAAVAGVPGLAVCGAAYDGVGIPSVIASARRAARALDEVPGRDTP
jgi:oxygen-dependent protoporphyrinogen oxidase